MSQRFSDGGSTPPASTILNASDSLVRQHADRRRANIERAEFGHLVPIDPVIPLPTACSIGPSLLDSYDLTELPPFQVESRAKDISLQKCAGTDVRVHSLCWPSEKVALGSFASFRCEI